MIIQYTCNFLNTFSRKEFRKSGFMYKNQTEKMHNLHKIKNNKNRLVEYSIVCFLQSSNYLMTLPVAFSSQNLHLYFLLHISIFYLFGTLPEPIFILLSTQLDRQFWDFFATFFPSARIGASCGGKKITTLNKKYRFQSACQWSIKGFTKLGAK